MAYAPPGVMGISKYGKYQSVQPVPSERHVPADWGKVDVLVSTNDLAPIARLWEDGV